MNVCQTCGRSYYEALAVEDWGGQCPYCAGATLNRRWLVQVLVVTRQVVFRTIPAPSADHARRLALVESLDTKTGWEEDEDRGSVETSVLSVIQGGPDDPVVTDDCEFTQVDGHEWYCSVHDCTMVQKNEPVFCAKRMAVEELVYLDAEPCARAVQDIRAVGTCPSCDGVRPNALPGAGLFEPGSVCPHCGHVEPGKEEA